MYNKEELNVRLLSELKEIAEELGLKNYKRLSKEDLIYKILDQQAVIPEKDLPKKKEGEKAESKEKPKATEKKATKPRRRQNVAAKKEEKEPSADELLESFNIELDEIGKYEEEQEKQPAESKEESRRDSDRRRDD